MDSSSPSSSSPPPKQSQSQNQPPLKQACDNCRRRKIKCNREQPCDKCQRLLLSCSYCDVLQRKGPKFRTLYPLAPLQTLASQYPTPPQSITDQQANQSELIIPEGWPAPIQPWNINNNQSYEAYSSPDSMDSQYDLPNSGVSLLQPRPRHPSYSQSGRLSPTVLLAHVNVYLKYLYPIMPVLNPEQLLNDSQDPDRLNPQRYALVTALCAATHVQLQLDEVVDSAFSLSFSGVELLAEATNARNQCSNICEHVSVEALLTSFFLFAAHGNLGRHDQAWFYLSQATSMAHTLGLHREATYVDFGAAEGEERRRVFWLLFVTERAYALQQSKPIMLRNSIRKPRILSTDDPTMQCGFHNLINIFEKITADLYDWISIECDESFVTAAMRQPNTFKLRNIHQNQFSSRPIPIDSVMEIQNLDVAATQQWLNVMLWNLSMSDLSQPASIDALLPFHLPVLVGKTVMDVLQGSTALHERRLFNRGNNNNPKNNNDNIIIPRPTADPYNINNRTTTVPETADINSQEFLLDILNILSRIRQNNNNNNCYPPAQSQSQPQPQSQSQAQFGFSSPSPPLSSSESIQFFQQ